MNLNKYVKILALLTSIGVFIAIGFLPHRYIGYAIMIIIMHFYVSTIGIDNVLFKVLILVTIMGLIFGWWADLFDPLVKLLDIFGSREGFIVHPLKLISQEMSTKQCQDSCQDAFDCKYAQLPLGTALTVGMKKCEHSFGMTQTSSGSENQGGDTWVNKQYKNPVMVCGNYGALTTNSGKVDKRTMQTKYVNMVIGEVTLSAYLHDQGWGNPTKGIYIEGRDANNGLVFKEVLDAPRGSLQLRTVSKNISSTKVTRKIEVYAHTIGQGHSLTTHAVAWCVKGWPKDGVSHNSCKANVTDALPPAPQIPPPVVPPPPPPPPKPPPPPPKSWKRCAGENGRCYCNGLVSYGKNGRRSGKKQVNGSIACNNSTFGDPCYGVRKECACYSSANGPYVSTGGHASCRSRPRPRPPPPKSCIGSLTKIQTANDYKMVKDLKVGDIVKVWKNNKTLLQPIFYIRNHGFKSILHLEITCEKNKVILTDNHLIYLDNGKLIRADCLNIGNKIKTLSGYKKVTNINKIYDIPLTPCTTSGTLITDGNIIVSCWSNNIENVKKMNTLMPPIQKLIDSGKPMNEISKIVHNYYNWFVKNDKPILTGDQITRKALILNQ